MIKLNSNTFRRAIEKAQTVRPACAIVDTDETNFTFQVRRADSNYAIVDIWHVGGVLWSSCDCPAGTGVRGQCSPLPCYHVAAAALSLGLLPAALPIGAVIDPAPEGAAARQVPAPLLDPRELAPAPEIAPSAGVSAGWLRSMARALAPFWFGREVRA